MKKSLLALAVLGAFAGVAQAQSSVTLYGVVDANYTRQKGGTNTRTALDGGGLQGNRWGMRGTEDLGGGLKANFVLESGFNIDEGTSGQGNRLFGRAAWVGVGGGFGEVRLGRHLTPIGVVGDAIGNLGTKSADIMVVARTIGASGGASNGGNVGNLDAYRTDNSINYLTPSLGGLTAHLQYSTRASGNEVAASKDQLQHAGLNVMFNSGPFAAGVGYLDMKDYNTTLAGNQKAQSLLAFGSFNAGFAKFTLAYNQDKFNLFAKKPTTIALGVEAPVGPVTLSAGYGQVKDSKGLAGGASDDASIFNVQAVYNLSKRTALYAFYTGVSNDAAANLGYNTPALDKSSNQFQLGLRHRF